jgi:hypothetical protein
MIVVDQTGAVVPGANWGMPVPLELMGLHPDLNFSATVTMTTDSGDRWTGPRYVAADQGARIGDVLTGRMLILPAGSIHVNAVPVEDPTVCLDQVRCIHGDGGGRR